MSILIKGMEMPKEDSYIDIRLHTFEDGEQCATIQTAEKPFYKKLDVVEVPEPHGRLIDADELFLEFQTDEQMRLGENLQYVRKTIEDAPTVIEAEGEK